MPLTNNCEKTCVIWKITLHFKQVTRRTFRSENCDITIGQIFLSARESIPCIVAKVQL